MLRFAQPSARHQPRQRRSQATCAAIIESAEHLLATRAGRLTMREVARAAGISARTLYLYFTDRQALAGAVLDHGGRLVLSRLAAEIQLRQASPLPEAIPAYLDALLAELSARRGIVRRLLGRLVPLSGDSTELSRALSDLIQAELERRWTELRPGLEPAHAAFILAHSLDTLLRSLALDRHPPVAGQELRDELLHLILCFLLPPGEPGPPC